MASQSGENEFDELFCGVGAVMLSNFLFGMAEDMVISRQCGAQGERVGFDQEQPVLGGGFSLSGFNSGIVADGDVTRSSRG